MHDQSEISWPEIITETCEGLRVSRTRLADMTNLSKWQIQRIIHEGTEPRYSEGVAILRQHEKVKR
jgi:predicted transcriptional regulator